MWGFYKQAQRFPKYGYVKQFTVLNNVSNYKPMIIIQNAYSVTEIDKNALYEMNNL